MCRRGSSLAALTALVAVLAGAAWSAPTAAAGDTVLSTASPPRAGTARAPVPAERQRGLPPGVPVPALPQPYPPAGQMQVYVGPDGVVAAPLIDMNPNSGVVYAPPPPRSSVVDGERR